MNIIYRLGLVVVFLAILISIISYARGYRLDFATKSVTPTGILAVSSSPTAAKIYVNGQLKGVTNTNLTLPPGKYTVEIKRDGYTSWSKTVNLQGEVVVSLEALLFPSNPSLSPLTNLDIVKAVPIDLTGKIIIFSESGDATKDGIYLFDSSHNPLSFLPPTQTLILKSSLPAAVKFTNDLQVDFSPDFKQAIFEFNIPTTKKKIKQTVGNYYAYLFSLDQENQTPFDVTNSKDTLIEAWNKERNAQNLKILETFPKDIVKIASDSFKVLSFSPDETKILYTPEVNLHLPKVLEIPQLGTDQTIETRNVIKNKVYVYDEKEDKNFDLSSFGFSVSNFPLWYPDSGHLLFNDSNKIVIFDYDGTNQQVVYSAQFEQNFFTVTPDGKIVVLTNLNPEINKFPDLYLVGIR